MTDKRRLPAGQATDNKHGETQSMAQEQGVGQGVTDHEMDAHVIGKRDRLVIVASSLGTVFEWYDFFMYGTLAALLGSLFFPVENPTAAFLASLAAFGAGFGVRPIGAVVFGHLGDMIGRKYTFLVTITLMGVATAAVGILPTYAEIGIWAPVLLVTLRLLQGLALGGEYGGAAIYVAEHAPRGRRGFYTSWIQMSVVGGFLLSLAVVLGCRAMLPADDFNAWGWRIPFIFSLFLLAISLYIRLKLKESPVFQAMKAAGETSRNPLKESFSTWANTKLVLVALFGVSAGLTVIWYTAQFSSLYFLQQTAQMEPSHAQELIALAVILGAPAFVVFGWLSDKVGRKKLLIAGYALTLALLFPLFHQLADAANPALARAMKAAPVTVTGSDCQYNVFAQKGQATDCARAIDYLTKRGISYTKAEGTTLTVSAGDQLVTGYDEAALADALAAAGYPLKADPAQMKPALIIAIVVAMTWLSGMTYGQVAALLVELFPARVRYTSLSVPYHLGTGYFGGFLPFVSQYIIVKSGDVYAGLWYTWGVVAMALVVSLLFLPETKDRDIGHDS